jgi:hypothetical protein
MTKAEELSQALDALNGEIDEVERYLESLGIGERASVPFGDGTFLVFGKQGSDWRLFYENGGNPSPLTSVSKHKRIAAVALLPQLLEQLRTHETTRLEEVKTAIAELRRFRGV